jgi:hypothetical protein
MAAAGGGEEDCFDAQYVERNGQMIPRCPMCGNIGGVYEGVPYIQHEEWCDNLFKSPCYRSVPPQITTEGGARRRVRRKSRKSRKSRKNRRSTRRN